MAVSLCVLVASTMRGWWKTRKMIRMSVVKHLGSSLRAQVCPARTAKLVSRRSDCSINVYHTFESTNEQDGMGMT